MRMVAEVVLGNFQTQVSSKWSGDKAKLSHTAQLQLCCIRQPLNLHTDYTFAYLQQGAVLAPLELSSKWVFVPRPTKTAKPFLEHPLHLHSRRGSAVIVSVTGKTSTLLLPVEPRQAQLVAVYEQNNVLATGRACSA